MAAGAAAPHSAHTTAKTQVSRRRKLIGRRRVDDDDGADDDPLEDDSLTDGSIASDEHDAADDSDTSNIDEASPTVPLARKGSAGHISMPPAKPGGRRRSEPDDTARMLRSLSLADKASAGSRSVSRPASRLAGIDVEGAEAGDVAGGDDGTGVGAGAGADGVGVNTEPSPSVKAPQPAVVSSQSAQGGLRRETAYEKQRREHDLYKQKRDEDPSFVPNRGAFFMHDHRGAGPAANGFRPFARGGRGRGRGGYGGLYTPMQSHVPNPADPTNSPWAHDMHDTIVEPVQPRLVPPRRRFETASHYGGSQAAPSVTAIPTCAPSEKPINRAMSVERLLGTQTIRVFFPPMEAPALFEKFKVMQYTKLPDHRPPLRRDKAVVIDLPEHPKSQIFPAVDRSFIFIPRAMRPNQQRMRGNRARSTMGSISGFSRTPSMFGGSFYNGSMYSPSIALSRRSSITHEVGRDYHMSPAGSTISRPPLAMDNSSRPVVRLPPTGGPPVQGMPMGPSMGVSGPAVGLGIPMAGPAGSYAAAGPVPHPPFNPIYPHNMPPPSQQGYAQTQQQGQPPQQSPQQPPQQPGQAPPYSQSNASHQVPGGSSLSTLPPPQNHPLPQKPTFQETRPSLNLPMHQPRPQKAVSVDTIEPQAAGGGSQPPQQPYTGPFHQQVPIQVANGFSPAETHSRQPSYPSYTTGTPLSQIPERAIHAAPFQPTAPAQPGVFSQPGSTVGGPSFYNAPAQYPMVQPPPSQPNYYYQTPPTFATPVAPSGGAPAFHPAGTPQGPGPVYGQPSQGDVSGTPVNGQPHMVAQEANGMVYYYDPSHMQAPPSYNTFLPAAPPQGQFMPGMVTPAPAEGYYFQPQPGMVYYPQ